MTFTFFGCWLPRNILFLMNYISINYNLKAWADGETRKQITYISSKLTSSLPWLTWFKLRLHMQIQLLLQCFICYYRKSQDNYYLILQNIEGIIELVDLESQLIVTLLLRASIFKKHSSLSMRTTHEELSSMS